MTLWRAAIFATLLVAPACASHPAPHRSRPESEALAPADLLPNDLDFVVRIDARRMRGEPAVDEAARGLAKAGGSGLLRSIAPSLERARAIFVGGRLMSDGFQGDGVVAIEIVSSGAVGDSDAVDPSFRRVAGAPDHLAIFERASNTRDEATLEIVLDRGGVVLATAAEADAVLRVARAGPDVDRLDPPARGLASFAARIPATSSPSPSEPSTIRRIAQGLARCSGVVDGGDALHVEAELAYASPEAAADAASLARSLLDRLGQSRGPLQSLADSVKLAREAEVVRVRASVPFAVVEKLH